MIERLLLCTDLDRTLIPNGELPESPQAMSLFKSLVGRPNITLAYVSGRHRALVEEAIEEFNLPLPDFVIGDVGTTIYHVNEVEWQRQPFWDNVIAPEWAGHDHAALERLLQHLPELQLQEPSKQNRYKLSYYVSLKSNKAPLLKSINQRLSEHGIKANLIWSVDEEKNIGLLDVLPATASKFHAIESLMEWQGFDYTNTVFCGDSGNDIEVLVSPISAVLVANSPLDVQIQATQLAEEAGYAEHLYVAKGGFLGMNGNYGAGMLEGIAHFHPDIRKLIASEAETA